MIFTCTFCYVVNVDVVATCWCRWMGGWMDEQMATLFVLKGETQKRMGISVVEVKMWLFINAFFFINEENNNIILKTLS